MLASLASVSISVTNVLAVETSERVVHRAMMTRVPEALEATLHPHATGAVAEFLLHKMVGTSLAGRVLPEPVWKSNVRRPTPSTRRKDPAATLDDLHKAVTTLEEIQRTARRVFGGQHPTTTGIEGDLRKARDALRAHETPPRGA